MQQYLEALKIRMGKPDYLKLAAIPVSRVHCFISEAVELCNPDQVFICTDSPEDIAYVRHQAVVSGEEKPLATPGHTYHFDGPRDQGRDRESTKYLVPKWDSLDKALNQVEREEGLAEIKSLLRNTMRGRIMIVRFLSLGPVGSVFSIPCMECTDSWYVAHSVDLLYRPAYEMFRRGEVPDDLFCVLHSAGKLDERMISMEPDKKRVYIDYVENTVYSVNTQYGGNSIGFKKLALRLTIRRAHREGWLVEHMMITGVYGPGGRKPISQELFQAAVGKPRPR